MEGNNKNLTFGFDIGIASVGWAVISPDRIVALGVRAFDKAETAKEGESLNLARRSARLMRRRLYRRAWRQTKVARLLKREGLIADARLFHDQRPAPVSPWQLRVEGLDRLLAPEEWARVIYHLCKHRGFHWISRAEEKKADEDAKGESGKVKKGLADTKKRMGEKGYRTAAEMVLAEFPDAQRNKQGDYGKALSRVLLAEEIGGLFDRQRALGNPHAGAAFQSALVGNGDRKSGLFWLQKPALSGDNLLKMLGRCTFEKAEYRAPKASFTAERHVWLTRLNNLRIVVDGETRPLNEQERRIALPLPYLRAGDLKHEHLRTALVKAGVLNESFRFAKFSYAQSADGKAKDPESAVLVKLPAWQELRKLMKDKGLETEWQSMAGAALAGTPESLDSIAWVLSVYKDDVEVERELGKLNLPGGQAMIDALGEVRFDKFSNLSLKALYRIVPHMETGLRYDEACESAGYHHSQLNKGDDTKEIYLPPFYESRRGKGPGQEGKMIFSERVEREIAGGIPRNPVVLRALNQARKVMNALIREYGSPASVHIEMARELSKPFDERRDIKKDQDEYQKRNQEDKARFAEHFGQMPKGQEFEKWRLYREQQGKSVYPTMTDEQGICAYSLSPIDLNRLLEPGYVEIDHALPYSRSFDDSKNNKVLVLAKENRDKGNATPYEYLDGANDSERWRRFVAYVEGNKAYRLAKRTRLLRKNFGAEEAKDFSERNLNDTRYICKFFKNYVERYLKLADDSESKRCVVLSGQLTAFLRARWGLMKIRSDSDRHHALDAAVVAACSHGMVKRLSDYSRRKELEAVRDGFVDLETGEIVNHAMHKQLKEHFPDPWPGFRHELEARLFTDDPAQLRAAVGGFGTYPPDALHALKPLFVSRAVQRRQGGVLHQDTIRSARLLDLGQSHVSVQLQKLKTSDLDNIVGASDPRNSALIELLRIRLAQHNGDGKKAFAEPIYKPSAPGKKAPLIRTVKLASTQKNGMRVRGGVADLGEMLHVAVYRHVKRHLIEPVYAAGKEIRVASSCTPDDAEFLFSLTKNDYVRITLGDICHEGYFVMYESDGRMTLRAHDQPKPDKEYFRKGVASAVRIEKFHVDVLGNRYPAPPEKRRDLA